MSGCMLFLNVHFYHHNQSAAVMVVHSQTSVVFTALLNDECLFLWKCFIEMLTPSVWWRLWSARRCFVQMYVVFFGFWLFQLYSDGAEHPLRPCSSYQAPHLSSLLWINSAVFHEFFHQCFRRRLTSLDKLHLLTPKKGLKWAAGACFMAFCLCMNGPFSWSAPVPAVTACESAASPMIRRLYLLLNSVLILLRVLVFEHVHWMQLQSHCLYKGPAVSYSFKWFVNMYAHVYLCSLLWEEGNSPVVVVVSCLVTSAAFSLFSAAWGCVSRFLCTNGPVAWQSTTGCL